MSMFNSLGMGGGTFDEMKHVTKDSKNSLVGDFKGKIIKIVSVGDVDVGKVSLFVSYTTKLFPEDYCPSNFETYDTKHMFKSVRYSISLCCTSGQEEYDELRVLNYEDAEVVLCCFSVTDKVSLENVKAKWVPEVRRNMKTKIPIILVGLKSDKKNVVSKKDIDRIRKESGCADSIVCSAKLLINVTKLIDMAIENHIRFLKGEDMTMTRLEVLMKKKQLKKKKKEVFAQPVKPVEPVQQAPDPIPSSEPQQTGKKNVIEM